MQSLCFGQSGSFLALLLSLELNLATAAIHFASYGNDTQDSNAHLLSQPDPSNIPRYIVLLHTIDFLVLIAQ
jgi:hypothetical protein